MLTSLPAILTLSAVVWAAGIVALMAALRARWFSRFAHGFFIAVALAIAGVAGLSAIVIGRWGYVAAKQGVDTEVAAALSNVALIVEGQVRADVRRMRGDLEQLALTVAPQMTRPDSDDIGRQLQAIRAVEPHYVHLRVLGVGGELIAASDASEDEPFHRVAAAYALEGTTFISDSFKHAGSGTEAVVVAVPITDANGAVQGAITSVFDLQSALEELVVHSRFNRTGYAAIVDGDGDLIAHPVAGRLGSSVQSYEAVQRAWASRGSGSVVAPNDRGDQRLFFYRALENPSTVSKQPWVLLTEVNEAEELAVLSPLQRQLALGVLILIAASLVLARQIALSLDRPLASLKQFAARLGQGDLEARTDVAGRDVAGALAESMNAMADGLRERDRVKDLFGRYIATGVSERILKGEINLGGEARVVTVLFSDIRSFTAMAESMPPQQVVAFLNEYFSEMVEAVFEQGGVLDKFIGDGMMAVFGSLGDQPDHAVRAVRAALGMRARLAKLNANRAMTGRPPFAIGIGIHTDEGIVGNIGSKRRLEYTVVGDGVNTSSRVEALNKELGTTILITGSTYDAVQQEVQCRPMPETPIRGKQHALRLYEVVAARALDAVTA